MAAGSPPTLLQAFGWLLPPRPAREFVSGKGGRNPPGKIERNRRKWNGALDI